MPGAQQRAARRAAWARRVGPVVAKADATASAGIGALPAPLALPCRRQHGGHGGLAEPSADSQAQRRQRTRGAEAPLPARACHSCERRAGWQAGQGAGAGAGSTEVLRGGGCRRRAPLAGSSPVSRSAVRHPVFARSSGRPSNAATRTRKHTAAHGSGSRQPVSAGRTRFARGGQAGRPHTGRSAATPDAWAEPARWAAGWRRLRPSDAAARSAAGPGRVTAP